MTNTKVPFYKHDLGEAELKQIENVFSGAILTTGSTVQRFEERFASLLKSKSAVGLTSCTGALHLSLLALGISEGDEVITTPMTFIATSTAILEAGATPVFADVEPDTGNIDVKKIEQKITGKTKAIMPVHLYGQMCDMVAMKSLADTHGLKIIEDAAHCIEGSRDGYYPGQLADFACFSFYATKNLTCGEGGALVTNSSTLAEQVKLLRTHGMNKTASDREREGYTHWDMTVLGWKYNMDNIQAAMLLPQLDRLDKKSFLRHELSEYYREKLQKNSHINLPTTLDGVKHALHLFPIFVESELRDLTIEKLQQMEISTMVNYRPVHLNSYFRTKFGFKKGDFPIAEEFGERVLSLPFFPGMTKEQVDIVVNSLERVFK